MDAILCVSILFELNLVIVSVKDIFLVNIVKYNLFLMCHTKGKMLRLK